MDQSLSAVQSRGRRARTKLQTDQLHAILERQIDQGRLRPGERIATERELAVQFGASRSVVRSALAELHKAGKIVRKVGHGTLVTEPTDKPGYEQALPLLDTSPLELLEFRLAMEPGLAEAITLNASERDLQVILHCVEQGDQADGWEAWEHWDRAFHVSLIAATHNRLAIGVYDAIIGIRHERPWLSAKQGHTDSHLWHRYQQEHRRIVEAVINRDAKAASEAIRQHLGSVRLKMLGT